MVLLKKKYEPKKNERKAEVTNILKSVESN